MRSLLFILFSIITAVLLFEGGFYIGLNFHKVELPKAEDMKSRPITIPSPTEVILETSKPPRIIYQQQFKSASGSVIKSTPALQTNILENSIYLLTSADSGLVKEATISYKFRGKIVRIEKDTNYIPRQSANIYNHFFVLDLENPQTGVTVNVISQSNQVLKSIKVWSSRNQQNELIPITIDDLRSGDLVEVEEVADLVNGQVIKSNIVLLGKTTEPTGVIKN